MKRFLAVFFLILSIYHLSSNPLTKFADEFYAKNQFELAANSYEKLLQEGYNHEDIHYNLGNVYFRLNKIGKSILHYEKAIKLNPLNQDAVYNLKIANLKVASKVSPIADFIFIKWWKALSNIFIYNTWAYISIGLIWMALIGLLIYLFIAQLFLKKMGFFGSILCLCLAILSFILGYSNKLNIQSSSFAIIQISEYSAKSEPTEKGKEIFLLKEGMKVKKLDEVGKWSQIILSDGIKGWVESSIFENI